VFNRVLLFLGLLTIMILLAGMVFSKTENPKSLNAKLAPQTQNQQFRVMPADSILVKAAADSVLEATHKIKP
jgi:hypothetical protein